MTSTRWQGLLTGSGDAAPLAPAMRSKRSGVSAAVGPRPQEVIQMLDARFPVEVVGSVPVVAAPEEIDITNAEALRSALLRAAADGHRTLVVDMTQTQFCDSSGLHTLIAAHRRAEAEGREVLLVIQAPPFCGFSCSPAWTG